MWTADALLSDINQAGLGRSLQFELFRPGQVSVKDYYAELPIAVRVNGRYHDLGAFASDIANLSQLAGLTTNLMSFTSEVSAKFSEYGLDYNEDIQKKLESFGVEVPKDVQTELEKSQEEK